MAKRIIKPKPKKKKGAKNETKNRVQPVKIKTLEIQERELDLCLPTEFSTPVTDIGDLNILLYGEKGIGKTSLAAQFPSAFNLQFESGGKGLKTYQRPCPTWLHFRKYLDLLRDKPHEFKTIIIDTGFIAYERCFAYAMEKLKIEHPSEVKWGSGWDAIRKEFSYQMGRTLLNDMGLIVLAHEKKDVGETATGHEYTKIVPQLQGQAETYFAAEIDLVGHYHFVDATRWLTIQGSDKVEAKQRLPDHFLTIDGEPIFKIPMGNSPQEAYENIVTAFNNEQEYSYNPYTKDNGKTKTKTKFIKPSLKKRAKKRNK